MVFICRNPSNFKGFTPDSVILPIRGATLASTLGLSETILVSKLLYCCKAKSWLLITYTQAAFKLFVTSFYE
jgi:uncharacterized membrane protein